MASSITILSIPPRADLIDSKRRRKLLDRLRQAARVNWAQRAQQARHAFNNSASRHPVGATVLKLTKLIKLSPKFRAFRLPEGLRDVLGPGIQVPVAVRALIASVHNVVGSLRKLPSHRFLQWGARKELRAETSIKRFRGLFRAVAVQAKICSRVRRRRTRRLHLISIAPSCAEGFVNALLDRNMPSLVYTVIRTRQLTIRKQHVTTIQRTWQAYRARQRTNHDRKDDLLGLLGVAYTRMCDRGRFRATHADVIREKTSTALAMAVEGTSRRLAARLLQRVWRGYCVRVYVNKIIFDRQRRAVNRLRKERLRKAQMALLSKTPGLVEQERVIQTRCEARKQATPLMVPTSTQCTLSQQRLILQPLGRSRPPEYSTLTRARVIRLSVTKFDSYRKSHAKINPLNTWVAVPVGFQCTEHEEKHRAAEQSPGTVTRPSQPREARLHAQYDWIPATLLAVPQHRGECPSAHDGHPISEG